LNLFRALLILHSCFLFSQSRVPEGKFYPDGHGGRVYLPLGDISFADEVIRFNHGNPRAIPLASDSSQALGVPNFDSIHVRGFVSLGCRGSLVLHFRDNALVNIPGPDLYVFEVGKFIEATELAISKDGKHWIDVGKIKGGKASVDIGDSVKPGEVFHYVRLTDLGDECHGQFPGADIDAVAAIGCARQISLKSAILFNFDKAVLKPEAINAFDQVLEEIKDSPGSRLIIEGHTDSLGSKGYNDHLSIQRALSVKNYFAGKLNSKDFTIEAFGYGAEYPVASNKTKEGQEQNRRVEIIIIPPLK
jgi:OOP family OmpA-OmpF porin